MDWTPTEVKLIVADYFEMFQRELNHLSYNKSEHRRTLLPFLSNREEGAIEFKHCNISAALANMGLPYINGYKPRFNYQKELLEKAISDYILENRLLLENKFEEFSEEAPKHSRTISYEEALDSAPLITKVAEREPLYRPIRTNYLEKEQNNRSLGELGESFVIEWEKSRLIREGKANLSERIEWVSKEQGDGLGYDILSKNANGSDRYIEVKTTKLAKETPIFVSSNEVSFARYKKDQFYLYRVFNFQAKPQLFIKVGEYQSFCKLIEDSYRGYFT